MTVTTGARGSDSCSRVGLGSLLEEGVRIVELGGERRVAHFLDDDHRRLLVELLVDRDHLAELHQLLDDLRRLHRHLVGEVGHRDRLGDVDFLRLELGRRRERARRAVVAVAAAAGARRAPAGASGARRAARRCLEGALLGGVVGPARRELLRLDRLLVARLGDGRRGGARGARLLVDRALDRFLGGLGRLGLLRLLGDEHLLRRRHHVADGGGLVLGGLAALGQVVGALLLLVLDGARP